jgi:hypothetical protein
MKDDRGQTLKEIQAGSVPDGKRSRGIGICPDEEFLINPSAKSLGGLRRSWRIFKKIRLSRQIALERSSTG